MLRHDSEQKWARHFWVPQIPAQLWLSHYKLKIIFFWQNLSFVIFQSIANVNFPWLYYNFVTRCIPRDFALQQFNPACRFFPRTCKHAMMKITMLPAHSDERAAKKALNKLNFLHRAKKKKKVRRRPATCPRARELLWWKMGYGVVQTKLNFNQKTHYCCSSELHKE